jgi:hypothetical protein
VVAQRCPRVAHPRRQAAEPPMNRDQVLAELQALKLTSGQYVVVGGAALAIRDIRDTEDIDLVVTPQLFDELAARGWQPKARPSGKPASSSHEPRPTST